MAADTPLVVGTRVKNRRKFGRVSTPPRGPSSLHMLRLEERDVPAGIFTGTVFLDTNANGQFDATPITVPLVSGNGSTTLAAEVAYSGLQSPFDPITSRVPVTVTAFDAGNAAVGSATTGVDGRYSLSVPTGGQYRLEFSNLPAGVSYGPTGTQSGTAVQFLAVVNNGTTGGANLGLVRPEDVTVDNPLLVTQSYVFGASDGLFADSAVVQGFPYNSGSRITGDGNGQQNDPGYDLPQLPDRPIAITQSQVGATWGLAFNKATNQLYIGAYDKRHSGYGPGTGDPNTAQGQIYAATPPAAGGKTTTATPLVNLAQLAPDSAGKNYRADSEFTNPANVGPTGNPYIRDGLTRFTDTDGVVRDLGWDAVGKNGLGGLDTDPSGRYLFTVGLGDRKLYVVDLQNPTAAPQSFALPVPDSVTGKSDVNRQGDLRPFAVQFYRGSVYVGAVNSGESTISSTNPRGVAASLRAFVFQFKLSVDNSGNLSTGGGQFVDQGGAATSTTAVLDVPLNYARGYTQVGGAGPADANQPGFTGPIPADWNVWTPTFKTLTDPTGPIKNIGIYPQPMLTGLAFDTAGNVVLGIRDRAGDQFGVQTPSDPTNLGQLYTGITAGDTLKAFTNEVGGQVRWALENNGQGPNGTPRSQQGVGNQQGPGGGEFYSDDFLIPGVFTGQQDHQELTVGGVLQLPNYAELATTAFDPAQITNRVNTGGVRFFDNAGVNAGGAARSFELFATTVNFRDAESLQNLSETFAKSNGVGDLVAITGAPTEIGNRVWADLNKDGKQDSAEPGLAGVVVNLFKDGVAAPIATATTDAQGNYFFTSMGAPSPALRVPGKTYGVNLLTPGMNYSVRIPLAQAALQALTLTTANVGPDNTDSDATAANGDGVIPASTAGLPVGAADHTFDAGFVYNLTLGDYVWKDINNDGRFQAGEPALGGIRVELVNADTGATVSAQTTNAQGGYLFTGLNPGNYRVRIPLGAANPILASYASSSGTPGQQFGPNEFTNGVPVQAANNADSGTTVGDAVLGPVVALLPGRGPTGETAESPNFNNGIADPAGVADVDSYRNQDFGFYQPISLGDTVWLDANNNGTRDSGEPGIAGVTVQLVNLSGPTGVVAATTTTNAAGGYLFTNLNAGTYVVRVVRNAALNGLASSTGANGQVEPSTLGDSDNDRDHGTERGATVDGSPIVLTPGGAFPVDPATIPAGLPADNAPAGSRYRTQDFGFYQPYQVGNLVFEDVNNNGVVDAGDNGIAGVPVELFRVDGSAVTPVTDSNGQPRRLTTDANGNYLFTGLTAGTYVVRITTPAGFMSSTGSVGSPSGPYEPGLAGGDLTDNADHGTAVGDGTFIQTSGVNLGGPNSAAADAATDGTPGRANLRQDFGLFRKLTLGDLVFDDRNNDGVRQSGESPIGGVTVRLLDGAGNPVVANGVPVTATTAADGGYLFTNLVPGNYRVEVVTPAGYVSSTGGVGSPFEPVAGNPGNNVDHGTTAGGVVRGPVVTLAPGTAPLDDTDGPASATALDAGTPNENSTRNQDFGFYRPLVLGDLVFLDNNDNGTRDAGEAGVSGLTVTLRDGAGTVVGTTTTDAAGNYLFTGLTPGTYQVEIASGDYVSSTGGSGSPFEPAAQSTVNDVDKGTLVSPGRIQAPQVTLGEPGSAQNPSLGGFGNLTQDFGVIPVSPVIVPPPPPGPATPPAQISGLVYVDANANGTRDGGEAPIPNVLIFLDGIDQNGTRVSQTTRTGTDGRYSFTGLVPGLYTVREQQPDGRLLNGLTFVGSVGGTLGTDVVSMIRLASNDNGVNYDFSEIPTGSTFGYVWVDDNRNGIFEAGESPIPNVPVTISGTILPGTRFERPLTAADVPGGLTVNTSTIGRYDFPSLPFGNYKLTETQPQDYVDWMEQDGDPFAGRPTITNDMFSGVTITSQTPIRGPFNFGEILVDTSAPPATSPLTNPQPSKRDFLGSTTGTASALRTSAAAVVIPTPPTDGVVAPVARTQLMPSIDAIGGQDPSYLVAGTGAGSAPLVRVFDYSTGLEKLSFLAYEPNYTGGVRVATGDVNGDGVPDIIAATGVGGGPRMRVFSGIDGAVIGDFFAYEETYRGGLSVAVADVNGDGFADIVTGTDQGGGPRVRVFDGRTLSVVQDFFAFDSNQRGGVRVAAADFNRDGRADIVAATGTGVPARVVVFDAVSRTPIRDFAPYEAGFTGGVNVAAGDFNRDGVADIVTGADVGGGPRVRAFDGASGGVLADFYSFNPEFTGGARVAADDLNGDGVADLAVAAGSGGGARVTVYSGAGFQVIDDFFSFDPTSNGGSYVAAGGASRALQTSRGNPANPGQVANPLSLGDPRV